MNLFLLPRRNPVHLYDAVSEGSAAVVIRHYSSSFGLASRLLAEPVRTQVRNVYALVRVADEIVDNPDPALGTEPRERMLGWLHDDVRHALQTGWTSTPSRGRRPAAGSTRSSSTRSSPRCGPT